MIRKLPVLHKTFMSLKCCSEFRTKMYKIPTSGVIRSAANIRDVLQINHQHPCSNTEHDAAHQNTGSMQTEEKRAKTEKTKQNRETHKNMLSHCKYRKITAKHFFKKTMVLILPCCPSERERNYTPSSGVLMITKRLFIISTQLCLCKSPPCLLVTAGLRWEGWIWKAAGSLYPMSEQKSAPIKRASPSLLILPITGITIVVNIVWEIKGGLGETHHKASWCISVILISFYHSGITAKLGAFVCWLDSLTVFYRMQSCWVKIGQSRLHHW